MKKWISGLLGLTLLFSVSGCAGDASTVNTEEPSVTAAASSEPTDVPVENVDETGGTLVAYFSWSGNTAAMAEMIQQETGGDMFEITPAAPYTDDYNALLDIARQEQNENARPELATFVENWESYDTVFLGYPCWWSDAPMAVYTFVESYDWTGKTSMPVN